MTDDVKTYAADDPANPNNLVVRGTDGDPLPHPKGVRMVETESYERVIEGLKMAADACAHLAKIEPLKGSVWIEIAQMLDKIRRGAVELGGRDLAMKQTETQRARGEPLPWRKARERFLDGIRQATGGMRQLATCFRGDFHWSMMAQRLERYERNFRALLRPQIIELQPDPNLARKIMARPAGKLIIPPGLVIGR